MRDFRAALQGIPLPAALVDLAAVDHNLAQLLAPVRAANKTLRLASKSIRCPALLRYLTDRSGGVIRGVLTYAAAETAFLAEQGFDDLLLAYPTVQESDANLLAATNARGASAAVVVDAVEHLTALDAAARAAGTRIPVVVELDLAYRPLGSLLYLGVRRSPLRDAGDVVAFVERIGGFSGLRFHGLMGYEAQIAGLADTSLARRGMKRLSRADVAGQRARLVQALAARDLRPTLFNGGGTGSLGSASTEAALTEVAAGSGFLDSLLFDHYRGLQLEPALFFALQAVRRPAPGMVTCLGGGYIASGGPGAARLPQPVAPAGARLLPLEGAGEVQTPVRLPAGVDVRLGDPVLFRPAKTGELAEHFNEYLLVRDDRVVERAPTYRGLGRCFLG